MIAVANFLFATVLELKGSLDSLVDAKTALMKTSIYYINKLKQKLTEAQEKNPHYSLRAYARDLGIHPASLSLIIKSKRAFPQRMGPEKYL